MLRRTFLSSSAFAASQPAGRKPNFLFITADDLGPYLSCYGEKRFSTPNLDRLAGSGVRFSTAYVVQASCSPSRSGMFTGLYPHSNGQLGLANTGFRIHEHLRDKTIPALLKPAGYRTGIIGKLHVEPEDSFPWDHRKQGNTTRRVRTVAPEAEEFIRASGRNPFFLMVNFSDPHAFRNAKATGGWDFPPQVDGLPENPIPPGPDTLFPWQGIDNEQQRIRTAGYFDAIRRLDTGVGLLMDTLARTGNADNTVVVFCGDHGPPFTRGKTTVYEPALRIPFILRWPGVTRPRTVSECMVSTVDILPTILDAAGLPAPGKLHGDSLRKAVTGGPWREFLAGEFHFHGVPNFFPRRAIRDSRYQLIHNLLAGRAKPTNTIDGDQAMQFSLDPRYDGTPVRRAFETFADPPEFELYDLSSDPIEFSNLAGQPAHAAAERRLKQALLAWRKQTDDPFLDEAYTLKVLHEGPPPAGQSE